MDSVTIQTTQNVSIDYPLAGAGLRIGSFFIDLTIFIVVYWIVALLLLKFADSLDDFSIIMFGALFSFLAYNFLMELFNRGQTLGKRIVGLRVIRLDGRDPTPADFLTRALFLLPDVIISWGITAVLLIVSGRNNQRLGDMVAGTVVIRTTVFNQGALVSLLLNGCQLERILNRLVVALGVYLHGRADHVELQHNHPQHGDNDQANDEVNGSFAHGCSLQFTGTAGCRFG
jgi:uncharacterized RDD family membrane protein YckC